MKDMAQGNINTSVDTFYVLLTTASYTPDKAHTKRSDITNEVSGSGYTSGGAATTITVAQNNLSAQITYTLTSVSWPNATITNARYAVIYKRRGGAASADELFGLVDDLTNTTSTNGTFTQAFSSPFVQQN